MKKTKLSEGGRIDAAIHYGEIFGIEPALALAIFSKETGCVGFCAQNNGRMKINFEQSVFNMKRKTHKVFVDRYGPLDRIKGAMGSHASCAKQHIEWGHLRRAKMIHLEHAYNSTGMGIAQVQGWEGYRLGYKHSRGMFFWLKTSEPEQIKAFYLFLQFGRGGVYPLFGPRRAPLSHVGPVLKAARRSQRTGDMLHLTLKYRGNKEFARKRYAPKLAELYARWCALLSCDDRFDDNGLMGYGQTVGDEDPVTEDFRGVPAFVPEPH